MAHRRHLVLLAILLGCTKSDPRLPAARQELDSFAKSVRDYRDQRGRWPPNLAEAVGRACLGERHDCLSEEGKRLDPWGSVYEYDQSLRSALVRSPGPDKVFGTRDDLEVDVRPSEPSKLPEAPAAAAPASDGGSPR